MTSIYYLFSISPPFRALVIVLMSIGILWPLMMIHYLTGYQDLPPIDLALPFILMLIAMLVRVKLTKKSISLFLFRLKIYNTDAFLVTTRQEGKLHRVFIRSFENEPLKTTLFLFNFIPVEIMEYKYE